MGWKNDRYEHGLASKGIRTSGSQIRRVKDPVFRNARGIKELDIQRHYWGMEFKNGEWKLRLGNWSDAGWYWSDDETDMFGFLVRMNNSKVKNEIIEELAEEGIEYNDLKELIINSIKEHDSGMYQLTGDNNRWKFGYGYDFLPEQEIDYYSERYNLSEEDEEEISEIYYNETITGLSVDLDKFEKTEIYSKIKDKVVKEIENEVDNWNDLMKSIEKLDDDILYDVVEYTDEIGREEFSEAFYTWKARQEKDGRVFRKD